MFWNGWRFHKVQEFAWWFHWVWKELNLHARQAAIICTYGSLRQSWLQYFWKSCKIVSFLAIIITTTDIEDSFNINAYNLDWDCKFGKQISASNRDAKHSMRNYTILESIYIPTKIRDSTTWQPGSNLQMFF